MVSKRLPFAKDVTMNWSICDTFNTTLSGCLTPKHYEKGSPCWLLTGSRCLHLPILPWVFDVFKDCKRFQHKTSPSKAHLDFHKLSSALHTNLLQLVPFLVRGFTMINDGIGPTSFEGQGSRATSISTLITMGKLGNCLLIRAISQQTSAF